MIEKRYIIHLFVMSLFKQTIQRLSIQKKWTSSKKILQQSEMSTVAACIIGNEVLNGKTVDTNSNYLAKKCFTFGLQLKEIRVIPDKVETIADAVLNLSKSHDIVFTSGGIGPTHDDMTYESIAKAFNRSLYHDEPTMQLMKELMQVLDLNEGRKRMALLPTDSKVYFTPGLWVPLVQVENVLILPGVPRLFHSMLDHWFETELPKRNLIAIPNIRMLMRTEIRESELALDLKLIQEEATKYGIDLGSYPKMPSDGPSYVILSLVGPQSVKGEMERLQDLMIRKFDGKAVENE